MALMLAASMLFMNTNSSLFAKEEAKGEEISEQTDKPRQPSSISYAPTQQALLGSTPLEETKEEPKEETETPKTEAVQTVEVKTTIYLDANKNEKKDKEEKGVSDIEVRLYKMQEGTAEKEASYQAITNIKGEVCLKDVETGSYRIEYESMDSEKDLKDYTIIQEKKDITKATDKEKELNKKTDIKKTEKENKTILYQEEVEIQEAKELEAALYKEEKEPEETKNGSKTEASKETKVETENKETSKQEVVKKQTETAKEEATKQEETSKSIPQLHKLAATQVGAAYGADSDLIKALNEVLDVEDWTFNAYYVGQYDKYQIEKKNDFNLKYQVEFHNNRDLAINDVEIRIPATLLVDRDSKKILPNSIAIPEGSKENPVASKVTPFNYYLDETTNELVFFNYRDISAGSNVAFQVLYKNIEIMQIKDGTSWSLTPKITVKKGEESEVKETTPLKGKIDTQINLTNVKKSPYTTGKSYYPGIYTKKQLQKTVFKVDQKYLDHFDDYYFVAWKIEVSINATQPWNLYLKETSGTDGELVGFNSNYQLSDDSKFSGYYEVYKGRRDKSMSTSIIAVTAYPKDGTIPREFENTVEVKAKPADNIDTIQEKESTAKWVYVDYEWKYPNDAVGINKSGGNTYRGWIEVFKAKRAKGQDMKSIPFHVSSLTRGYKMTHHVTNEENKLGERIPGATYKMTTVDDFIYVYPNTGTSTNYKILDSKDYYYNQVTIQQKDTGYDPWEDETATPEESGNMVVYAMYEGEDTWSEVETIPWNASGTMSYTFTKEQIAKKPWRVKVEHESVNYNSTCTIDVAVMIKHESPVFNDLIKEEAEGQNLTLENIAGVMTEKYQDGKLEYSVKDTMNGTTNYSEPELKDRTEALYNGNLLIRDNAYSQLYSINKHAESYKYGTNWNDPVNGRINLKYNIMAYDGYELYGKEVVEALKEGNAQEPGRKDIVFYDLLPYGVKYDPSVDIKAGRVKGTSKDTVKQERSWDSSQISITLDSKEDVIANYKKTGRTLLKFHVHYNGEDPAVLTNYGNDYLWMEGWGISFGAYYDWKDIDICNAATNISAFMPKKEDNTALLGQDNEVMKDNGQEYPSGMKQEYQIFGSDIDNDGNTEEKTVLYASAGVYDDMAIASSSEIVKDVRADDDRFGSYSKNAVVEPGNGYTYEITVKNAKGTLKNIVVYDLLEDAPNHLSSKEHKEEFEENWWYGTFDGVITTALEKAGAEPVVYYNEERTAKITKEDEEPSSVLTKENGWIEASQWDKELKDVKAVAVDLRKNGFAIRDMGAISFQIHMLSPQEDESSEEADHNNTATGNQPASYAYNNTAFYSEEVETNTEQTVIGNSVQVAQHEPERVEIVKAFGGDVPKEKQNSEFRFIASYNGSLYATQEYQLFKKIDGTWERQGKNRVYATEVDGSFYLHADEKAVFDVKDKNLFTVEEEENPFWKVEINTEEQDGIQIRTYKNTYRPVLYAQKKLENYPKDKEADVKKEVFTFQAFADGEIMANAEYWLVDSVRTDGGIPKKLNQDVLKTDENGKFKIKAGEIVALFPGVAGTQYEIEETEKGNDWFTDAGKDTVTGTMVTDGNSVSITNYYKWKDLYLTKELTHQKAEDCTQVFTFQVFSKNESFANAEWVILKEDGTESDVHGTTDNEGKFSIALAGKTVKIKGFEAGTSFKVVEIDDTNDNYEPIQGTVEGTMPLYAVKSDATIINDYILRPISVTKMVSYDAKGITEDKLKEINDKGFTMTIKVKRALYANQEYTIKRSGEPETTGITTATGTFTIKNGQTITFNDVGPTGTDYEITETQDSDYPQIFPANGKSSSGTIDKEGSKVTFVNGTANTLLIGKEYIVGDGDVDQIGESYLETIKKDPTIREKEKVTLKLEVQDANGNWKIWPSSRQSVQVTDTLNNTMESITWNANSTLTIEPWKQVVITSLNASDHYRLSESVNDQYKLYKDGANFIEITQKEPVNDGAIQDTIENKPLAIIKNQVIGKEQKSIIQKKMKLGSDEVPTGSQLVFRVESYDGLVWNPANEVSYIVGDDNGWINNRIQKTEADGKITVEKTEKGYPIIYFTEHDVKINPSNPTKDTYRIVEVLEESEDTWGVLSGYQQLPDSYNGSIDKEDATTFINSNRTTPIEIAKVLNVNSEQEFTFELRQVTRSKQEVIKSLEDILESRKGTNINYVIYDAGTDKQVATGNTGTTGEIKIKGNQYARLDLPDDTAWTVSEKQDTPYILTDLSGTEEKTLQLTTNMMLIQAKAPIILADLSIETDEEYFIMGSKLDKSKFTVHAIYSDGRVVPLSDDDYEIDKDTVPKDVDTFDLTFTYSDKHTGESIHKVKTLKAIGTIELTKAIVNTGVIDGKTGQSVVLNTGDVEIPEIIMYEGNPRIITSIGNSAFYYNKDITSVKMPKTLTSIGGFAFRYCEGLTGKLVIPDTVTSIGWYAFSGCSGFTGNLRIPSSVTSIEERAFQECSGFTGNLVIPKSVTSIEYSAFEGCSGFTGNLVIPDSVTSIEGGAFEGCSGFTGNLVIPNSITSISIFTFSDCSGFKGNLVIPESVTSIGTSAFSDCSGFDGTLTIGNSVTSIGGGAFSGCSGLTGSLIIPNSVTSIGGDAFSGCSGLTGSLIIPDTVTSIEEDVFENCSGFDGTLTIGNSVTSIGYDAFLGCSGLTGSLIIPNSVTSIGYDAFYGCSGLTGSLTIPNAVTSIEERMFQGCSGFTGNLVIPKSVTSIEYSAFEGCSGFTGNLVIPDFVTSIEYSAFEGCSGFTGNLVIPDSVTSIKGGAFEGCSGLTGELIIPDSVTSIGESAFQGCSGLTGELIIPDSVTSIRNSTFAGCKKLTGTLKIPDTVTSIEDRAFQNCIGFNGTLTIGNSVTNIGSYAFFGCSRFTGELKIPNTVTNIGSYAFYNCTNLEKIIIQGKSEGEISGSPWGAYKATIVWQPSQEGV